MSLTADYSEIYQNWMHDNTEEGLVFEASLHHPFCHSSSLAFSFDVWHRRPEKNEIEQLGEQNIDISISKNSVLPPTFQLPPRLPFAWPPPPPPSPLLLSRKNQIFKAKLFNDLTPHLHSQIPSEEKP